MKKMYNVYNKSNIYFVYDRTKNRVSKIGNYVNLVEYVASCITPTIGLYRRVKAPIMTKNSVLRTLATPNSIIHEQNLTGKDVSYIFHTNVKKCVKVNEDGESVLYNSYFYVCEVVPKPYTILDGNNRVVDIRIVLPDVIKLITSGTYTVKKESKFFFHWYRHTSHVCYQGSRGTPKRAYVQREICKELNVHYRNKADNFKTDSRYGSWDSRQSAGWKHNKDKHQWDHNLRNHKNWRCNSPKNYWLAEQEKQFAEFELEDAEMFGIYDELSDVA